jgi:hypothetical protein
LDQRLITNITSTFTFCHSPSNSLPSQYHDHDERTTERQILGQSQPPSVAAEMSAANFRTLTRFLRFHPSTLSRKARRLAGFGCYRRVLDAMKGFTTLLTSSSNVPALSQHLSLRQHRLQLSWLVVRPKLPNSNAEEEFHHNFAFLLCDAFRVVEGAVVGDGWPLCMIVYIRYSGKVRRRRDHKRCVVPGMHSRRTRIQDESDHYGWYSIRSESDSRIRKVLFRGENPRPREKMCDERYEQCGKPANRGDHQAGMPSAGCWSAAEITGTKRDASD